MMFFRNLETDRLELKNIGTEDRDLMFSLYSDAAVNEFTYDEDPLTDIAGADDIIQRYVAPEPRGQHRWVLVRKEDGAKLGTCGFHFWNTAESSAEIGYELAPGYWGNGYMHEALSAIITFADAEMKIRRIDAVIYTGNAKSIRTAEKLDFIYNGDDENTMFHGKEYLHHIFHLYLNDSKGAVNEH